MEMIVKHRKTGETIAIATGHDDPDATVVPLYEQVNNTDLAAKVYLEFMDKLDFTTGWYGVGFTPTETSNLDLIAAVNCLRDEYKVVMQTPEIKARPISSFPAGVVF